MRRRRPAFLLALLYLLASAALGGVAEDGEILLPGQARERTIAGGETQVYRVQVAASALLLTVEQKGINLVVEAQGPAARISSDTGDLHWGPEVLLLERPGEQRIEVRSREKSNGPGRYSIQLEDLAAAEDGRRAALALTSRAGQQAGERTPEARRQAVDSYRAALAAWRALGDRRWEADSLDTIAALEAEERDLRPAAQDYSRAVALWRELGDPYREAASLNELGVALIYAGESEAAGESLRSALAIWQRLGERFDEGQTRSNLCYLEQKNGLQEALACYQEIRTIFRQLGDRSQEPRLLNLVGGVYDLLGKPDDALRSYEEALSLCSDLTERLFEAQTLNNIAVIHRALGEWQEALRFYGQERQVLVKLGDRMQEGLLLNNMGFTYNNLGEPQRALPLLEDALSLLQQTSEGQLEVAALNNLGSVWLNLGDLTKSLEHHRRALDLATALRDPRQEAISRLRLGEVQLGLGSGAAALRELEDRALDYFHTVGNRRNEAQALYLQARALALAGRPHEAMPLLETALAMHRTLRDRVGEADALHALAETERSLGQRDRAWNHAAEAVARVEELRTGFVSPNLRAAFLATQRRAYSLLIDLLMDRDAAEPGQGHDRQAFEVSEGARARSLLDVLHAGRSENAVPADLLLRQQSLRRRLSSKADQQLKQGGAKAAEALGKEIDALLAELDGVEAEIRRLDPKYAAVSAPPSLGEQEIATLLDPDTLLLEYSLGESRSYLWAVSSGSFRSFILPPRREIEALARRLYADLSTREFGAGRRMEAAEALSRILLAPVWPAAARVHRLVVIPDTALHLLPFGALPSPGSGAPLLEQLEIVYLPSATTLAQQRKRLEHRPPAAKWAAVFADPVFTADDPRLTGQSVVSGGRHVAAAAGRERGAPEEAPFATFERLPASQREAAAIAALAPAGQVWMALNLEADREAVLSAPLRDYRVIHFATHAVADVRTPELSGLVLSLVDGAGNPREGFLGLSDIYELDLRADLVVLSGCRTALGKEVRGEGTMGLTRGFLYAGVPRVLASLWRVQDRATAELMVRFYRAFWRDHLPAAAALRSAQRSLRLDPRYRDPYFWAGFVLQGDWR